MWRVWRADRKIEKCDCLTFCADLVRTASNLIWKRCPQDINLFVSFSPTVIWKIVFERSKTFDIIFFVWGLWFLRRYTIYQCHWFSLLVLTCTCFFFFVSASFSWGIIKAQSVVRIGPILFDYIDVSVINPSCESFCRKLWNVKPCFFIRPSRVLQITAEM